MTSVSFKIIGAPRTKNTGQLVTRGGRQIIIPSKPYRRWFKAAMDQVPIIRVESGLRRAFTGPVEVTAIWYRDRDVGDEDRFKNALGDFLQKAGFVANDRLIHWSGGCRRNLDRARPRTEVTITAVGGTEVVNAPVPRP